jgi:hypothetical protein
MVLWEKLHGSGFFTSWNILDLVGSGEKTPG